MVDLRRRVALFQPTQVAAPVDRLSTPTSKEAETPTFGAPCRQNRLIPRKRLFFNNANALVLRPPPLIALAFPRLATAKINLARFLNRDGGRRNVAAVLARPPPLIALALLRLATAKINLARFLDRDGGRRNVAAVRSFGAFAHGEGTGNRSLLAESLTIVSILTPA